jgi:hypothetical protein
VRDCRREELGGGASSGAGSLGEGRREHGGSQRDAELAEMAGPDDSTSRLPTQGGGGEELGEGVGSGVEGLGGRPARAWVTSERCSAKAPVEMSSGKAPVEMSLGDDLHGCG